MCSPNSVSALQPTPSSSAPSLQFPTLPTRCPFAQSAVAVSHSSTPRRRSSSRFSKKVSVAVYHSRAPSRRLAFSRSPSRPLAVAVSHVITGRRLSPLPLLEVQSTSPSPSPSPTLQDSR
nr:hypothetical protein Itr_chr11CG20360 [Ipomoea trifida]